MSMMTKSIGIGFLVSTIGIAMWSADIYFFGLTLRTIIVMAVLLSLYWKFFSGQVGKNYWPARREAFRKVKLPSPVWKWGLLAGLLFVLIIQSSFVVTFRLIELPDSFSSQYVVVEALPMAMALLVVFMSSLVAGVCEEVGFRGYMQVPLEKKFGPAFAITVVSITFSLIHLDRSWAISILPIIFFASVLLGILAYQTQSLLPGIIGHTVLDIFDYSFWWTKIFGQFKWKTIFVVGMDAHFIGWILVFALSTMAFAFSIKKLDTVSQCA